MRRWISTYLLTLGDALSQLINAALFNSKNANESLSGRAFSSKLDSKLWYLAYRFINFLFFLQNDHCKSAYHSDLERARSLVSEHNHGNYKL